MTRAEARDFDRWAIETVGIPSLVLMENAGRGAADVLLSLSCMGGPVVVACGKGNNGGDGMVIARHLANRGVHVAVWLFAPVESLSPEAAIHWRIVRNMGIFVDVYTGAEEYLPRHFTADLWVVDALYGTGLTGPVRLPHDRVIEAINASGAPVFAVDVPSGLDADTGRPMGATIRARHTATFVAPKVGFAHAAEWTGQVHVVDIGIAPHVRTK